MSAGPEPGLERVAQVAVVVRDPERALRFYRDVLGLRLLFQAPPALSFFDCGGVRLMLTPAEGDEAGTSVLYYAVPDLAAAHRTLEERGVAFEAAPRRVATLADRELWMAFLRDSEGNLLALTSELPREG